MRNKIKNNLLVTLADNGYINQAKQLFSSIFFNSNWDGECMLISQDIDEKKLEWFTKRGIIVKKCSPLYEKKIGRYPSILSTKLHIFDWDMKKWDKIIYLDADVIVRKPLKAMLKIKKFSAAPENNNKSLSHQFLAKPKTIDQFIKTLVLNINYNTKKPAFNAGVFSFPTEIITRNTINDFNKLLKNYASISLYGDQGVQNLYFYNNWSPLPPIFNYFPVYGKDFLNIPFSRVEASVIHFADIGERNKPWHYQNHFYPEWNENLKKSEHIFFKTRTVQNT